MENNETGEFYRSNRASLSEGLSGIDLHLENDYLKIDGMPTEFSEGMGTKDKPLKTDVPGARLDVTLQNTRFIAERIEGQGPKRTLFFTFRDRLLGVDSAGHVQLIKNKEKSDELFEWQIDKTKELLEKMNEDGEDQGKWILSIVDTE